MEQHFKYEINKKIFLILLFLNFSTTTIFADTPYFLDFKYILNESDAGKKAQNFLKNKLETGIKNLKEKEKKFKMKKKRLFLKKYYQQKTIKKVSGLRTKVSSLQVERNKLLKTVATNELKPGTNFLGI